ASFVLPILEKLSRGETQRKKRARAIILTPTRELALQVHQSIEAYGKNLPLRSMAMFGGVDYAPQKQALIEGDDIVVSTPGRLIDLYGQRAIHFDEVEMLVLDEADKMLDMGFIDAIDKIVDCMPEHVQSLLFSATLSNPVRDLAKNAIIDPEEITIAKHSASKSNIKQWITTVDKDMKSSLLSHLLKENDWSQVLVYIETKHGAAKLVSQLEIRGIVAESFHSGRKQRVRQELIEKFKAGEIQYLVAT
ncbi:DEAD/DEAH box helicase, partial [Vibrio parahaemolyticus]|nr:DEAD/DEAH box helicase [Vibrio parahaemolyticus]